jgi:NAD(P)-dependent dehydrogenase (short-subunit alcohol dehydrogenase family)
MVNTFLRTYSLIGRQICYNFHPLTTIIETMVQTAVVSGGARGIGRCLVRRFLERGYKVYIFDIDEEELHHTTHSHLKGYTDAQALGASICDLRNIDDIYDKVEIAAKFLGGHIDVLINNGGIANPQWRDGKTMFDRETVKEWQA